MRKGLFYIKLFGVDIVWFMFVYFIGKKNRKGEFGSFYVVKDYLVINFEFGSEEDFKVLVDEVYKFLLKVIIDWVLNYSVWDNFLVE